MEDVNINSVNFTCDLLDSTLRTCWGLIGPNDPPINDCSACSEETEVMQYTETVYLQPIETCGNGTIAWNLTAGDNGTEIWRFDNYCSGIAISQDSYRDVEFKGKFSALDTDDAFY